MPMESSPTQCTIAPRAQKPRKRIRVSTTPVVNGVNVKRHSLFGVLSYAVNVALLASILLTLYGAAWEYSTRRYLKGFVDAVVPASATPEQKVEAILGWMEHGPARRAFPTTEDPAHRDPEVSLNYQRLLQICGTASNAFVNLAKGSGLESRRLLLLDANGETTHVVAETRLAGRWIVVDPAFRAILRDANGRMLDRKELADPKIFEEATQSLLRYDPRNKYERTSHVRLKSIPLIGGILRKALDAVFPRWDESLEWTLLTERESFGALVAGIALLLLSLFSQTLMERYGERHSCAVAFRLIDLLKQGGYAFLGDPLKPGG